VKSCSQVNLEGKMTIKSNY